MMILATLKSYFIRMFRFSSVAIKNKNWSGKSVSFSLNWDPFLRKECIDLFTVIYTWNKFWFFDMGIQKLHHRLKRFWGKWYRYNVSSTYLVCFNEFDDFFFYFSIFIWKCISWKTNKTRRTRFHWLPAMPFVWSFRLLKYSQGLKHNVFPENIYLLNKNTRKNYEIWSKLSIKKTLTSWMIKNVNVMDIVLSLLLTLNMFDIIVSIVDFEKVNE